MGKAIVVDEDDPIERPVYSRTRTGWQVRVDGRLPVIVEVPAGVPKPFLLRGLPKPKRQAVDKKAKRT